MPLVNRNLTPGTVLVARSKGKQRRCEVVLAADGLRYRLDDGTEHKSPSAAAKTAMGGVSSNGWRFWSLAESESPVRGQRAGNRSKEKVEKKSKTATKATRSRKKPKATRAASRRARYGSGRPDTFPMITAPAADTRATRR
jgi:hypothetical protein